MNKKLPKVFVNQINNEIKNNKAFFYSSNDRSDGLIGRNIREKINTILDPDNYIYKTNVEIVLRSGKVKKAIIGREGENLITVDDEIIKIADIIDINYTK